jgi:gliding motility-associated-like protein
MTVQYPRWKQGLYILLCTDLLFFGYSARSQSPSCTESSGFTSYFSGSFGNSQYTSFPAWATTTDNGAVFFLNKEAVDPAGDVADSLLVFKLDAAGSVVWSKALYESAPTFFLQFNQIIAMHNGNVLLVGACVYPGNNSGPFFNTLLLLDPAGNILWQKTYTGLNEIACGEGLNGEITVVGGIYGQMLVTRISAAGDIIWSNSYAYGLLSSINPSGLFSVNGCIYTGGDYTHWDGFTLSMGVWLAKIDYETGKLLDNMAWAATLPDACPSVLSPGTGFKGIPGGGFVFNAGLEVSVNCPNTNSDIFFIRVDTALQLSGDSARAFFFQLPGTLINMATDINPATGGIAISINSETTQMNTYYAILDSSLTSTAQRKLELISPPAIPLLFLAGYDFSNLGFSIIFTDSLYNLIRTNPSFLGSPCLGTDFDWLTQEPINCDTFAGKLFTPGDTNTCCTVADFTPAGADFYVANSVLCQQPSICDSLEIHGDTSFCPVDRTAVFTTHKSASCLRQYTWHIDTTAWTILGQPNDTTIQLGLKSVRKDWRGYIYVSIAGCGLKDSLPITIHGPMDPVNLGPDTALCPGTTILLQAGAGFQTYKWQDGSVSDDYLVRDTGRYFVTVTDFCGDSSSDTIYVRDCRRVVYFPNAFTPNHDGANDLFRPLVNGQLKEFELFIYNRWGELIFITKDPANGWDGSCKGGALPTGTYVWFCRYQFAENPPAEQKGTVLLIR